MIELYNSVFNFYFGFDTKLPYLPLMITSVYCSVLILFCWVKFLAKVLVY
jgi:hypothetical protein